MLSATLEKLTKNYRDLTINFVSLPQHNEAD
jgi:hypothetical protein